MCAVHQHALLRSDKRLFLWLASTTLLRSAIWNIHTTLYSKQINGSFNCTHLCTERYYRLSGIPRVICTWFIIHCLSNTRKKNILYIIVYSVGLRFYYYVMGNAFEICIISVNIQKHLQAMQRLIHSHVARNSMRLVIICTIQYKVEWICCVYATVRHLHLRNSRRFQWEWWTAFNWLYFPSFLWSFSISDLVVQRTRRKIDDSLLFWCTVCLESAGIQPEARVHAYGFKSIWYAFCSALSQER